MHTTPASLLDQLRLSGAQLPWSRFVKLYYPLIYYWARRAGASSEDAADLVQDVLILLIRKLPEFQYDRTRSFRSWLRVVTLNAWRKRRRSPSLRSEFGRDDAAGDLAVPDDRTFEEAEYRRELVMRALKLMQTDFAPTTWKACWASVVEDRPAAEVARDLGITVNAVYLAKSRVLRHLRQELKGLID